MDIPSPQESFPYKTWKILVIDDDEEDFLLVKGMLKKAQRNRFNVYWASTYESGIADLRANHYHAVLVDYALGADTGIRLIKETVAEGCSVPLILYTGSNSYAVDLEAMEAGATLYLSKDEANPLMYERSIRYAIELKQRELALRASEERFEKAFNASPNAQVISHLEDGRIVSINDSFEKLFGYSREEVIGKTSLELNLIANPDDRAEAVRRLRADQRVRDFEMEIMTRTGEHRTVNLSIEIIETGGHNLLLTVIEDITERRRAEQSLRELSNTIALDRNRLVTILNHLPVGVWIANKDGQLIQTNSQADQIWAGEAPLLNSVDQYHEYAAWYADSGQKLRSDDYPVAQALQTEQVVEPVELRIRRLDGTEGFVLVSAAPMKDGEGHLTGAVGINVDITKLRLAEEQLKYHASLLDNIHDAIIATDIDHRITAWNKAAVDLFGYEVYEVLGRSSKEVLRSEITEEQHELFEQQIAEDGRFTFESPHYTKDGRKIIVEGTVIPRLDGQGNIVGYVTAGRDITDRKRRDANLAFMADIAQDFSNLTSPEEIMNVVGSKLGANLSIFYCHFMYIDEERDEGVYLDRWNSNSVPRLPASVSLSAHITEAFRKKVYGGQTVVSYDTQTDPIMKGEENIKVGAGSFITVPIHFKGEWKYLFSVHDLQPRQWRNDEIELVRDLAHQLFPRLQRAHAQEALRESETKYRSLYDAMDEGFLLSEVIFDERDQPVDIRYLQANPSAVRLLGMDYTGKRLSEIDPNFEHYWYEIWGRVARTGVSERLERYAEPLKSWYNFFIFRVGGPESQIVANVFEDITQRKQAEETIARDLQDTRLLHDLSTQLIPEDNVDILYG